MPREMTAVGQSSSSGSFGLTSKAGASVASSATAFVSAVTTCRRFSLAALSPSRRASRARSISLYSAVLRSACGSRFSAKFCEMSSRVSRSRNTSSSRATDRGNSASSSRPRSVDATRSLDDEESPNHWASNLAFVAQSFATLTSFAASFAARSRRSASTNSVKAKRLCRSRGSTREESRRNSFLTLERRSNMPWACNLMTKRPTAKRARSAAGPRRAAVARRTTSSDRTGGASSTSSPESSLLNTGFPVSSCNFFRFFRTFAMAVAWAKADLRGLEAPPMPSTWSASATARLPA
mmetsp:Transcript_18225/g.61452  ORF Transcript_18225/g.61452 Transcript_18225/m.61452 type:complete len:295 (+) Transcript_18225:1159-2043(+)